MTDQQPTSLSKALAAAGAPAVVDPTATAQHEANRRWRPRFLLGLDQKAEPCPRCALLGDAIEEPGRLTAVAGPTTWVCQRCGLEAADYQDALTHVGTDPLTPSHLYDRLTVVSEVRLVTVKPSAYAAALGGHHRGDRRRLVSDFVWTFSSDTHLARTARWTDGDLADLLDVALGAGGFAIQAKT